MTPATSIDTDIGRRIWASRYRHTGNGETAENDMRATWRRVARALAGVERSDMAQWEARFFELLEDLRFLPGGRILAGAGLQNAPSLFNCFVMSRPTNEATQLVQCLSELTQTVLAGGGVGYDFSTVAPAGSGGDLRGGVVPVLHLWNDLCGALGAGRVRGGAMLGSLRCDHPDIEAFVAAKREDRALDHFNLSVLVTDAFMKAVEADADWPLLFPLADSPSADFIVDRAWPGSGGVVPCRIWRVIRAGELWDAIMRGNYDAAEPGVLFIDRMQRADNLHHAEEICTTNPCGEVPLPCYGACDLGSLNLTRFVREPFTPAARIDTEAIRACVPVAVRLLDNVYELSGFPLERQRRTARAARRVGLGVMGLADALIMLGLRYDGADARAVAADILRTIRDAAYRASADLAREKGAFELFSAAQFLAGEFATRLPDDIRADIARCGLRNSHLVALAPTGSISLLAGGVSAGIEPVPAWEYQRQIHLHAHGSETVELTDHACALFRELYGRAAPLPAAFLTAPQIDPHAQLAMHAALQEYVDNAVSKTITVPADYPYDEFRSLYERAYALGLKGCTTYRQGSRRASVLERAAAARNS
ncbi:MAG TPA: adenosylcobalamin-dependent ribonucleoside-diphosphate reductase [Rudaea sp.]|nr:adenosylcobalamin-dependent ribonucleoside-diphosphate reductase [Rudaea sp.]